jgi:hypothetical protein
MKTTNTWMGIAHLNGFLYLFGGNRNRKSVQRFEIKTKNLTELNEIPFRISGHCVVEVKGKLGPFSLWSGLVLGSA